LEEIPPELAEELRRLEVHRHATGRCLQCDLLLTETEEGTRVVNRADGFVQYVPYAARFPAQVRIVAERHPKPFVDTDDSVLAVLAHHLRDALLRLRAGYADPSFNLVLHGAIAPPPAGGHHWRVEVVPRLA